MEERSKMDEFIDRVVDEVQESGIDEEHVDEEAKTNEPHTSPSSKDETKKCS